MRRQKAIWWVAVLLGGAAVGVFLARGPWEEFNQERRQRDNAITEMREAESARSQLQAERIQAASEAGREKLAREDGWTREGEKGLEELD